MRIACWIPKSTNTLSEYVIPIVSPPQQRLHKRASMLPYTSITCLVTYLLTLSSSFLSSFYKANSDSTFTSINNGAVHVTDIHFLMPQVMQVTVSRALEMLPFILE